MNANQKAKNIKNIRRANVLESLKDIGSGTVDSFKNDLLKEGTADIFNQFFGRPPAEKKFSGELNPGESLEFNEVFSGKRDEAVKLKKQLALERKLAEEEKARIEKKGNELKLQLHALMQEVAALASTTQNLGSEIETAAMQAPVNPGVYHVIFFEKLIEFLKSFRKKIENASLWLHASNKRAEKKNFWGTYKKHGGKFLLSPDHYLQRSAG